MGSGEEQVWAIQSDPCNSTPTADDHTNVNVDYNTSYVSSDSDDQNINKNPSGFGDN